jgi:hypothetical protein
MRAYTEKKVLNHAVAKFGNFTISLKCGRFAAELLVISNFIDYLYETMLASWLRWLHRERSVQPCGCKV